MRSSPEVEPLHRRFVGGCVLVAVLAAVISVFSLEVIHPWLSWNRDEPVYLWHVGLLDQGRLLGDLGTPVEAFRPWLGGVADDGYFSQYTLGWPLVLLVAQRMVGTAAGAVVLGSVLHALGAVAVVREVLGRNRTALAVGALAALSPAAVIQAGVHLSYLFTAGLGTLALAAIWGGERTGRRMPLVVGGLLIGWVLLTRPFDAVVWGGVTVIGLVLRASGGWRDRLRGLLVLWPTVLTGVPFALATLAYNLRITGEALTFPIVATDPLDTFGFGRRRLMPAFKPVDYDVARAAFSSAKNGAFFVVFLAGNVVAAGLAVFGTWRRRHEPTVWILVALAAAFPLGYFAFWGMYISSLTARLVGAIYYIPSMVPVLALAAVGLAEVARRSRRSAGVVVVIAIVLTVPVLVSRLEVNRDISLVQEPWSTSVADLDGPALVIVAEGGPYLGFKNPQARNAPGLDGDIVYAVDLGAANLETLRSHPGRTPYLQVATADADELGPREDPVEFTVSLVPIEVRRGPDVTLQARFTPPDGAPVVVPFTEVDGIRSWGRPSDVRVADDGSSTVTVTLGPDALPAGPALVRIGFGAGGTAADAVEDPRVRWDLVVSVEDGEVVVVTPAQLFRRFAVGPDFYWYPRGDDAGVDLQIRIGS